MNEERLGNGVDMAEDKARERIEMNQLYLTQEILPRLMKLPKQSSDKSRARFESIIRYVETIIAGNNAYLRSLGSK